MKLLIVVLLSASLAGCVSKAASNPEPQPEPMVESAPESELSEDFESSVQAQVAEVETSLNRGEFESALKLISELESRYAEPDELAFVEDGLLDARFMALLCGEDSDLEQLEALYAQDERRFFERFSADGTTLNGLVSYRYFHLTGSVATASLAQERMSNLLAKDDLESRFRFHVGKASMLIHNGQIQEALVVLEEANKLASDNPDSGLKDLRQYGSLTLLPVLAMALENDFKGGSELIKLELQNSTEPVLGTRLKRYQTALEELATAWPAEQTRMVSEEDLPKVEFITDKGRIVITLFEDDAPNTVASFIELTEKGFYDGLLFHRVVPHFVVQGGDPDGTGSGGPGYSIKLEANRKHFRGSVAMARSENPDSAGSQFYFCLNSATATHLDGGYAVFGRVSEGLDVMDILHLGSKIVSAKVISKRDHEYVVNKLPEVE